MTEDEIETARDKARQAVYEHLRSLNHPDLRVGLMSDKDSLKLACLVEVLVEEVLREKLAEHALREHSGENGGR